LLQAHEVPFTYREYTQEPLTVAELERVFALLGVAPKALLRRRDAAYKALGLTGAEPDSVLIGHMAEHPTLLQRPIGVRGDRAVVGRPPAALLELVD